MPVPEASLTEAEVEAAIQAAAGAVHEVIGGNKIVRVRQRSVVVRISRPSLALSPTATVYSNTTLAPLLLLLL